MLDERERRDRVEALALGKYSLEPVPRPVPAGYLDLAGIDVEAEVACGFAELGQGADAASEVEDTSPEVTPRRLLPASHQPESIPASTNWAIRLLTPFPDGPEVPRSRGVPRSRSQWSVRGVS